MVAAVAVACAATTAPVGCATAPLEPAVEHRVREAVSADVAAYPELHGIEAVDVGALDDDVVFFQSNFDPAAALLDGALVFRLQANPRAFALGIDDDMVRGVLGHELAHSLDYQSRVHAGGTFALVPLAVPALVPSASTWERSTDVVAVARGFGPSLLRYRAWLFRVLDAEAVREKRAVYYSPLELALLIDVKARCPARFATFLEHTPRDARAIARMCP